ncbi:MAG: N utilization substance protein B-like protein [candidate division TM6 bacterium GW2011_GWE2_41_16]|nr:MAG: N utilization substance protein B-like protein [candidate division TM6 bacterium GW2011_GWE2_41_16]
MDIILPLISVSSLSMREQRAVLLSALYALDSLDYDVSAGSVFNGFFNDFAIQTESADAVFKEAESIIVQRNDLDEQIKPLLDNWRFDRLSVCTKLILRMGLWELVNTQTSPTVIINEAVELAKGFAETDAYKFVNGILDEWTKRNKKQDEEEHV